MRVINPRACWQSDYAGIQAASVTGQECMEWKTAGILHMGGEAMVRLHAYPQRLHALSSPCFVHGHLPRHLSSHVMSLFRLTSCLYGAFVAAAYWDGGFNQKHFKRTRNAQAHARKVCEILTATHSMQGPVYESMEGNYCRNPEGSDKLGAWCFLKSADAAAIESGVEGEAVRPPPPPSSLALCLLQPITCSRMCLYCL
jgi:hypothetical protein